MTTTRSLLMEMLVPTVLLAILLVFCVTRLRGRFAPPSAPTFFVGVFARLLTRMLVLVFRSVGFFW